jgi:hypothetical protein
MRGKILHPYVGVEICRICGLLYMPKFRVDQIAEYEKDVGEFEQKRPD